MDTATKAKELLAEIDNHIQETTRSLNQLKSERKGVARLVALLSGTHRGRVGRPAGKASKTAHKRTRTDWNKVISKFKGAFTLDDLSKASGKAKPTVNQAVQIMKKAGKIKSTGKRGEYQRAGAAAKAAKPKAKAPTKKATKKRVAKKKAAAKQAKPAPVQKQEERKEG